MRISDWSSDVCSSDLQIYFLMRAFFTGGVSYSEALRVMTLVLRDETESLGPDSELEDAIIRHNTSITDETSWMSRVRSLFDPTCLEYAYEIAKHRSEEHTSELQSLMRKSYDVF